MSETSNEDYGSGQSSEEENSNGQISYAQALVEWRSSDQVENGCLPYLDIDEFGSKYSELYGRHTWKIEKYSEINNKPALRSDVFDAGGYKWYILIYPKECDNCKYLALYLCLTNYEELHPGWRFFAQYTLALMNKDPKNSIYSDSVNMFWKMKNSGGWNKLIEVPKLQYGYIDDLDSLIIKAKVQVIREWVDRPFRCLSSQYRRELVRVYLPYVENICWQFIESERTRFSKVIQNKEEWQSFSSFWSRLDKKTRRKMSGDKMDVILNIAARKFFIMQRGTSTLMMDSLYSGWKAIEGQTKKKKSRQGQMDNVELPAVPAPIVSVDQDMFVLVDDLLMLMQKTVMAPFHTKYWKVVGNVGEEYGKESIGRDESRLAEVGRRTMEIFVLAHIYSEKVVVAYKEHTALKMQEELIHEEEKEWLAESKQKAKRGTTEKERKSKKKQAKQKKNRKEKRKEERLRSQTEEMDTEKEESVGAETESSAEKPDTLGESSPIHCELDASEIHHPPLEDTSRGGISSLSSPNGVAERKYTSVYSDESVQSGVAKGNVSNWQTKIWRRKGTTPPRKISGGNSLPTEREDQPSRHASKPKSQIHSSETRRVGESDVVIKEAHNPREHNPVSKVRTQEKRPAVFSPPRDSPWNLPSVAQAKPEKRAVFNVDNVPNRKAISARSPLSDQASPSRDIQFQTVGSTTSPKPSISRPLRAPTFLPKQAAPTVSDARTSTTSFARSTGRVSSPTYVPQSYKHAVVGSLSSDHSSSQSTVKSALLSVYDQSGFPVNVSSADVSSRGLLWTGGSSSNRDTTATTISGNHRMNAYNTPVSTSMRPNDVQFRRPAQSLMTDEFPHLGIINDLLEEEHGFMITSGYRLPQWLNDVYSFLADLGISGWSRSYNDDGFYQYYSECMSGSSSSSLYGNGQMAGLTRQTQWQSANMDSSLFAMRSQNNASESAYRNFDVDSSNPNLSARINGYRAFRPSNRN